MLDTLNTSDQHKRPDKFTQLQRFYNYLQNHIATASMVADATGIPQKCLTRYKRDLEKAGRLWEVKRTLCQKTGFKAFYLTTNPDNAPLCPTQMSLF